MKTIKEQKIRSDVGRRIAEARKAAGLTQVQLSQALEVNQQTVAFWECESPAPRSEILPKLTQLLNVSIDYLLTGSSGMKKPGPKSKVEKVLIEVSCLPKKQQDKIIEVVDALVMQSKAG